MTPIITLPPDLQGLLGAALRSPSSDGCLLARVPWFWLEVAGAGDGAHPGWGRGVGGGRASQLSSLGAPAGPTPDLCRHLWKTATPALVIAAVADGLRPREGGP